MKKLLPCLLLASLAFLNGCGGLRPSWHAPEVAVPAKWDTETEALTGEGASWWKNFDDQQLEELVDKVLDNNNDFAAAVLRVRRARLQSELTDTNLTPSASVNANVSATRTYDPVSTSRSSGTSSFLSYELDFWGKLASTRDAARWAAQATEADCRAFGLSLVGTTARLYWQAAYLNQLLRLNASDVAYAESTLALARARYDAGAVSALDVTQAELNLSNQQAYRTQLVQQRVEAGHALALLLNQPPEVAMATPAALSETPLPVIAADLPAATLANRPDVRAAELRLRESFANVDVTRTSFYPTFALTGSLGTSSTTLLKLLENPVATLGLGLSLPFIQWNTTQLSIRISETQYEEAVLNYRQRLYTALAEVEGSLSARTQLMAEEERWRQALVLARRAESIAETRFKAGYTGIQSWLDAQSSLRSTERSLAQNRLNQLNNQVNIYKALGQGAVSERLRCG
jgi:NodT family efflux transporter outer membrane factor (OMF) lipoprotein